jgi:hypothetical protein
MVEDCELMAKKRPSMTGNWFSRVFFDIAGLCPEF